MIFLFSFYKNESWLFIGDIWKENNFPFSRMNVYPFFFLVVRLENFGWMGGTAENAETFFFLRGGFLFLFLNLNAI